MPKKATRKAPVSARPKKVPAIRRGRAKSNARRGGKVAPKNAVIGQPPAVAQSPPTKPGDIQWLADTLRVATIPEEEDDGLCNAMELVIEKLGTLKSRAGEIRVPLFMTTISCIRLLNTKAVAMAGMAADGIGELIGAHRLDVSDLRLPPRWPAPRGPSPFAPRGMPGPDRPRAATPRPRPPSREECAGVYPLAGFRDHGGPIFAQLMADGDPVRLLPAIGHPAGRFTVVVVWEGADIGTLPHGPGAAIWRRLRARLPLEARIARIESGPDGVVEIGVW